MTRAEAARPPCSGLGKGCGPIDTVARTGPESENAAYKLLALFVRAFVVCQLKLLCSGHIAHELSASGPSSKVALIAGLFEICDSVREEVG